MREGLGNFVFRCCFLICLRLGFGYRTCVGWVLGFWCKCGDLVFFGVCGKYEDMLRFYKDGILNKSKLRFLRVRGVVIWGNFLEVNVLG